MKVPVILSHKVVETDEHVAMIPCCHNIVVRVKDLMHGRPDESDRITSILTCPRCGKKWKISLIGVFIDGVLYEFEEAENG